MMRDDGTRSSGPKGQSDDDTAPPTGPEATRPATSRTEPEAPRRERPALAEGTRRPQASLPSFAAVTPPKLDTPKGGGALRGMGESFRHNAATGTWSMTIPLPVTASPRGPTPELSLSYDVGQGQGVFGLGWSLSLPAITRRTDRKIPEYRDREDSDVFSLAGAEDLTPLQTEGPPGTWTRHTTRYRPRVEAGFAKIERLTKPDGSTYWQVVTRDNVTHTYGFDEESRIADPADQKRIFSWLLCKTVDDRGHVITYEYDVENMDNVPLGKPSEKHRRTGLAPVGANRYLKRVKYGNTTANDASTRRFELVFDYGDHTGDPSPAPNVTKACRVDPFSSYRSGFELRTYRLCKRVLMFHRFQTELGQTDEIVRALAFSYDETNPHVTKMTAATLTGYTRSAGNLVSESLPAMLFSYTPDALSTRVKEMWDVQASPGVQGSTVTDFPARALGRRAQWVDLDGEGIPGVLVDEAGALTYKRNLGTARLAPARRLPTRPSHTAIESGATQLMDIGADGRLAMVALSGSIRGYHERQDDSWGPFVPFKNAPNVDWGDPNLRLLDLDGDGRDDILITRGDHFEWYPSKGKEGWDAPRRIARPQDEERGPAVVFTGPHSTVFLADMSGDGLADLVRVTHSRVVYWPNLGHGRFGAMVTMDAAPFLEPPERFHPNRVRLADLDGTGTADLVYFSARGMHIYRNRAGNGFAPEHLNDMVPVPDALSTLSIIDLLGTGTSCAVWSPTPAGSAPLRYVDLFLSKKPNLLSQIDNSSGLLVRLEHTSSTKFYLADRKAGKPWVTKLPFPVHVTERVETYDQISKTRLVSTYSYHHGHYDADEREFRGFGRVDQVDAETFDQHHGQGLFPNYPVENGEQPQHPVLVKTWFHTGDWKNRAAEAAQYATEYWQADTSAPAIPAPALPTGLSPDELKEACRALRGSPLRVETYGLDGAPEATTPYSVSKHTYEIRRLQPRFINGAGNLLRGSFLPIDAETHEHQYERSATDPRFFQSLALFVDPYGTVTQSALLAYPRRGSPPHPEQNVLLCLVSDLTITHIDDVTGYRLAVPHAGRTFQLTGLTGTQTAPTSRAAVKTSFDGATVIPYHQAPQPPQVPAVLEKRIVEHVKLRYWNSTNLPTTLPPGPTNLLAFGQADFRGLVYETYQLDSTTELLAAADNKVTSAILTEGGYIPLSGESGNWIPSGYALPSSSKFFLPVSSTDPFGNTTTISYDTHDLLVTHVTDPLSNTVAASHDYRALAPTLITDPNGNRVEAAFDALVRVTKIAVQGKVGSSDGDLIANPTEEYTYFTNQWTLPTPKPNYVKRRARETHGAGATAFQESYTYTDGSGRIAMVKAQAEPGKVPGGGTTVFDPRWVGSGKTVINNKGNAVKQYEPFFSSTHEYQDEAAIVQWGVTAVVTYDALSRPKRVDNPNGTYRRSFWTAWESSAFDENDTLDDPAGTITNLWQLARKDLPMSDPERIALDKSLPHRATPTITQTDVLGRPFLVRANSGTSTAAVNHDTRTTFDIEGQPLKVTDPLGRDCQTHIFSIGGRLLKEANIDRGNRWMFANVLGTPIRKWDERDQTFRTVLDALQRPTHLFLKVGTGAEVLLQRSYYGDDAGITDPHLQNLRGQLIAQYDGATQTRTTQFDFKGNPLNVLRRLTLAYATTPDWSALSAVTSSANAETTAASLLEPTELFTQTFQYDALNRVVSSIGPDASGTETKPTYNKAGLLDRVELRVRGVPTWTTFVSDIEYNEKGQRTRIVYSSGNVETTYQYDQLTFRLKQLFTSRGSPANDLQKLTYTFDPVGNIVVIADDAHQSVFFNDAFVSPVQKFEYDAIYRLKKANGRENNTTVANTQRDHNDLPIHNLRHPNDPTAIREYTEHYAYDAVGNIQSLQHIAEGFPAFSWTRTYTYQTTPFSNNRLIATSGGGTFGHDVHGNMTSMPHLATITYSPFDQMKSADKGGGGIVYFTYDGGGQRVRKVWEHSGLKEERLYLGGFEIYRRWSGTTKELERETLHVMDGIRRIAMVETKTVDTSVPPFTPTPRYRYQLTNHLDTAHLEIDETGLVISYEEMHPYGTSGYRSADSTVEVSARRYRYTGKERDEETGFDYFGARYYAPWLGRWTTADPLGLQAGLNLYLYGRASPVVMVDPNGMDSGAFQEINRELNTPKPPDEYNDGGSGAGQGPPDPDWTAPPEGPTAKEVAREVMTIPFYLVAMAAAFMSSPANAPTSADDPALQNRLSTPNYAGRAALVWAGTRGSPVKAGSVGGTIFLEAGTGAVLGVGSVGLEDAHAGELSGSERYGLAAGLGGTAGLASGALKALKQLSVTSEASPLVASSGDDVAEATILRDIAHGEKVGDLLREVGDLTRKTDVEHGIVTLADGRRVVISGGSGGIDLNQLDVRRLLLHSHPPGSEPGPSLEDFVATDYYFQRSSWLLEVNIDLPDVLSRIRVRDKP